MKTLIFIAAVFALISFAHAFTFAPEEVVGSPTPVPTTDSPSSFSSFPNVLTPTVESGAAGLPVNFTVFLFSVFAVLFMY